jgi:hypothetical protein
MAAEPTTPTREHAGMEVASEDGVCAIIAMADITVAHDMTNMFATQDTFEDAPDITPRPRARSPESTRSLTRRRSSAATLDRSYSGNVDTVDGATEHQQIPTINNTPMEDTKVNGLTPQEEQVKRISISDMDEVNLGDGECIRLSTSTTHCEVVNGRSVICHTLNSCIRG